ncbi:MAG: hypothetical protein ACJA1C_002395 [Crocinitomicaceae bacterium]|jgi:hypothetical protein
MKKVTLTIASILLTGILFAQDYTPPSSAASAFKTKYPSGLVQEWYDNDNEIVCYFENGDNYGSAYFTVKGAWLRSEFTLSEEDMPNEISMSVKNKYPDAEIIEVTKIVNAKATQFRVIVYNPIEESDYEVTLDNSGKIIKEVDLNADY